MGLQRIGHYQAHIHTLFNNNNKIQEGPNLTVEASPSYCVHLAL